MKEESAKAELPLNIKKIKNHDYRRNIDNENNAVVKDFAYLVWLLIHMDTAAKKSREG